MGGDWYHDKLAEKQKTQLRAAIRYAQWQFWVPKIVGLSVVALLAVIAWKI